MLHFVDAKLNGFTVLTVQSTLSILLQKLKVLHLIIITKSSQRVPPDNDKVISNQKSSLR